MSGDRVREQDQDDILSIDVPASVLVRAPT